MAACLHVRSCYMHKQASSPEEKAKLEITEVVQAGCASFHFSLSGKAGAYRTHVQWGFDA